MSDEFQFQISVKVGDALFNVRAADQAQFAANLKFAHDNASQVIAFCNDFKLPSTHQNSGGAGSHSTSYPPTSTAPAAPFSPPPPPPGAHVVNVTGIEEKEGISEGSGKPWKKWNVKLSDGRTAGTFDSLVVAVAKKVYAEGSGCVAVTEPGKNPKYLNLVSIQRAA